MGTQTAKYKLYKPFSTEIINVDLHLNNNWKAIDSICKRVYDYQYTSVPSIPAAFPDREFHDKFYSAYSNSIQFIGSTSTTPIQDVDGSVASWVSADPMLIPGWRSVPGQPFGYRILPGDMVEWSGSVDFGGALIPSGATHTVLTLTPQVTPLVNQHLIVPAGNIYTPSSGYSFVRAIFNNSLLGTLQVARWLTNPATPEQNAINFSGIRYHLTMPPG